MLLNKHLRATVLLAVLLVPGRVERSGQALRNRTGARSEISLIAAAPYSVEKDTIGHQEKPPQRCSHTLRSAAHTQLPV